MKFRVINLTGTPVTDGPIQIDGVSLLQENQKIGEIEEEALNYLIEHRKELQILKFVDESLRKDGSLAQVNLYVALKNQIKNHFSIVKVVYYGVVMLAALISMLFSLMDQSPIWITLLFFLVLLSSSYLLFDYLNQHNKLERFKKHE